MTTLRAAGTLLAADPGTRRLTYRLLPYGEPGSTNLGVVTAHAGVLDLPAAAGELVLNLEHEKRQPLGRGAELAESADALDASFDIAATRAGDDLLEEAAAGLRTGISVELADVVIRGGRLVAGRLIGAGATVEPAFPSAQLVAADTGDDTPAADVGDTPDTDDSDDDNPPDQGSDTDDTDGDATDNPDTDDSSGDDMSTTTTTTSAPAAAVTASRAAAPAGLPAKRKAAEPGFRDIVKFLANKGRVSDGRLYAALSDITPGAGSADDIMKVPTWLGEVWDGRTFVQRYAPLLSQDDLTSMEIKGWKWTVKPEVAPYAGQKAAVPSNPATTEPYTLPATRIAGAHDIDRIFRDFGVEEFWTSYWNAMAESYARQVDAQTGAALVDGAPYVAPGTVPAGVSTAAAYIVDGAIAIIDTVVPDFAIVSKDLYRDLLLTRADDVLGYLNLALGLEEGTIASFRIVPGDAAFPADTVVVGAKAAATVYELPGAAPVRVEALNIANGGVDVGLFGYLAVGINDDGGLALVTGTPPVPLAEQETAAAKSTKK